MRVDVIGAGFSGLVTAFHLVEKGHQPRLFEVEGRAGGLIGTKPAKFGLIETAANAILNSENVEYLFKKIRVPLNAARAESRARYIFRDKPMRWPISLSSSFGLIGPAYKILLKNKQVQAREGESIREWGIRVLGREVTSYLLEPALQGIYAGDPERLSANLILKRVLNPEIRTGPGAGRRPSTMGSVAPPEGMGQLIAGLETYLREHGAEFIFDATLLAERTDGPVFFCGSAPSAAKWLKNTAPEASRSLEEIEMRPVTSITAFFERTKHDLRGFGVLFPRDQHIDALGVLFNDQIFEKRSVLRSETWIYGGTDASIDTVLKDRRCLAKASDLADHSVTSWPEAIPHYTVGLERILKDGFQLPPNLHLVGNYMGGLGLARILDHAKRTVEEAAL